MSENPKPTAPGLQAEFKRVLLSQIRPSKRNPRKIIRQEMIDARAASMAEEGQITPIIIRPLTPAELLNDGVLYEIVDGELRYRAALKNGDKDIDAKIEDISPLKAFKVGVSSNRTNKPGWFEDYLAMEEIKKNEPATQNQELAALFEVDNKDVTRALRIVGALNEASRALLLENFQKPPDSWQIASNTLLCLADLGDPQLVEPALKVAVDKKMTAKIAKGLVEWVKAGNPPETFGSAPKTPKQPKPVPASGIPSDEVLAKVADLGKQVGLAEGRGEDPKPAQDLLNAYLAEVKAVPSVSGTTEPEPTVKVMSLLSQSLKALFKNPEGSTSSPASSVSTSKGSKPFQIELKPVIHWFKKIPEKLSKKTVREAFKIEHHICRKLAHEAVPLHTSSHSGYRHHRSGSLSQGVMTLFLTILHWAVYMILQFVIVWTLVMWPVSRFVPGLKPWFEWPFRFTARLVMIDAPARAWAWATVPSHLIPALIVGCLLAWGYLSAWKVQRGRMLVLSLCLGLFYYYGRGWAESPMTGISPTAMAVGDGSSPTETQQTSPLSAPSTPVQPSAPMIDGVKQIVSISKHKEKSKPTSAPVMAYQPAVSFQSAASPSNSTSPINNGDKSTTTLSPSNSSGTLYDPKLLAQEIAALPKNCIVKSFPVLTDEGMPGDLAVSRIQGVTDPDKYTLIIDGDKKEIVNIATTTTNLIINCKSTDPLNFNGSGPFNVFWEDVLYIHTDEIDISGENPSQYFHCTLIGSGAKNALTFRCNRADDLKHLVSALQYFIRNSRLGHDTALAGMPFPCQGLVLNNACVVDKLWANSPMDKAAVSLGDHFWSIGKVTSERQSRNDLEAGLSTLPVTFFYATASEWDRALLARNPSMANSFRPRLRKVVLNAL
jgi:ParB/RepB/Spo0J family partition protein